MYNDTSLKTGLFFNDVRVVDDVLLERSIDGTIVISAKSPIRADRQSEILNQ